MLRHFLFDDVIADKPHIHVITRSRWPWKRVEMVDRFVCKRCSSSAYVAGKVLLLLWLSRFMLTRVRTPEFTNYDRQGTRLPGSRCVCVVSTRTCTAGSLFSIALLHPYYPVQCRYSFS